MNKYTGLVISFFTITGSLYAQNSEVRTLDSFTKILVGGNAKVYLIPSVSQQVRVESKEDVKDITTIVNNGELKIDGKPSSVYIHTPGLEEINIRGAGTVTSDSTFTAESMSLNISGNGKVIMPVALKRLAIDVSGFAKMKLEGSAEKVTMAVSGNSVLDAEDLVVNNASVQVSGVSKAHIDVRDTLDFEVSGVGTLYYKSEPAVFTRDISGIGKYGYIKVDDSDTTAMHWGKKKVLIIGSGKGDGIDDDFDIDINIGENDPPKPPKRARSHWAGFDLGFNGYFHDKLSTDLPESYDFLELKEGKSLAVGINI